VKISSASLEQTDYTRESTNCNINGNSSTRITTPVNSVSTLISLNTTSQRVLERIQHNPIDLPTLHVLILESSSLEDPIEEIRELFDSNEIHQYSRELKTRQDLPAQFRRRLQAVQTLGGGNCFYASVAFAFLVQTVFTTLFACEFYWNS
jgi:hypothetical protein